MKLFIVIANIIFMVNAYNYGENNYCVESVTTASGRLVDKRERISSGDLIFEDNFDFLDLSKWQHENSLSGGGNWEFQWYTNNRSVSFTENGILHIRPSLTSDVYGDRFLSSGKISLYGNLEEQDCTNPAFWGCERVGNPTHILNPVRSAKLRTLNSFNFKYGRVDIRAKLPAGDWLWPAIWLTPKRYTYGPWPASGEIDIMESRGNRHLVKDGRNIGVEQVSSTLHYGPYGELNAFRTAHFSLNSKSGKGFNEDFHRYQMEWSPDYIKFFVDDKEIGMVAIGDGMWEKGEFAKRAPGVENPWRYGTKQSPFDHEFHIVINLAVGGISFFPDDAENPDPKPWSNNAPAAATDFWKGRDAWLSTWGNSTESAFMIDYVRVYAI